MNKKHIIYLHARDKEIKATGKDKLCKSHSCPMQHSPKKIDKQPSIHENQETSLPPKNKIYKSFHPTQKE